MATSKLYAEALVTDEDGGTVWVMWKGQLLDRPCTYGISVGRDKALIARLVKAVNDGAAFPNPVIVRDNNGDSYVRSETKVHGRRLNADLRRLGY